MEHKYVVITGSLMSGLGKGIVTSSILKLMKLYGVKSLPVKFDGYLNYDCGTMNPFRHGEVFVLEDKGEVDMDFGNYERFLNENVSSDLSITGGKLFSEIIGRERRGEYLGRDVQIIPHITDYLKERIKGIAESKKLDVLLVEVGGTVGDIENSYFIEAMRQLSLTEKVVFVNLTYIPELESVGEQKTKPTQMALRTLMQLGIQPKFIICRSQRPLESSTREKLALFSNLKPENIIDDSEIRNIYELPLKLMSQDFDRMLLKELGFEGRKIDKAQLNEWKKFVEFLGDGVRKKAKIAVVGKYVKLKDSYASVKEALTHAAYANSAEIELDWIESEDLEGKSPEQINGMLGKYNGILVPGGFGKRGIEGMINAIRFARENSKAYLGLCLGMQLMAIEYARNASSLKDANSSEFNPRAKHKIIDLMEDQRSIKLKGGTMRLGAWPVSIRKGSMAYYAYGSTKASERHRHRYEFNNRYSDALSKNGLVISGYSPDKRIVEIIEWNNRLGVGTQAHPELKSRPENPAPLFKYFIKTAVEINDRSKKA
ncbi:MAG: CTP synthase [Candidatus Marsarchaeota archaeon]|nr:CTP synthase [Candidatus Marsarchaeota archaeon]MCL5102279.1 CTP synthase [Candidatus Marsarchaeota archaeon]